MVTRALNPVISWERKTTSGAWVQVQAGGTEYEFAALNPGTNVIRAVVVDPTDWIRDDLITTPAFGYPQLLGEHVEFVIDVGPRPDP